MIPKFRPTTIFAILLTTIFFSLAPGAYAQGIIIDPNDIPDWVPAPDYYPWPAQPITLQSQEVNIEIDGQFAHIKTTQIFKNNTWTDLEGTWVFPVPHGADISNFSLWLDGKELLSEILDAGQAASIYHQIVASMRDPGLLEYVDDGLIRANIYPIPAGGTKQIDMEYDWLLGMDSGLMKVTVPLKLDGYSIDVIQSLTINVDIKCDDKLGTIYSPTHDIDVDYDGPHHATLGFEKSEYRPAGNFILYISRPAAPVGVNLLTHSTGNDEGYFLAMIAPEYDDTNIKIVPKDFVCVLDTSGSMADDGKIDQAKEALDFIFRNLNDDDRFQLITFATNVYPYYEGWSEATSENLEDVREHIDGIRASGSTNIYKALEEALKLEPAPGRPMYVIFLTDGLPTVGDSTEPAVIIDHTNQLNSEVNGRIFSFGVGNDVDYDFIDRLSRENGGYTSNVAPDEDLEQPLSEFYEKIQSPVLTDIDIQIDGTRIYDMLPVDLPDLFLGSQLILTGRYVGNGRGNVLLTGNVGDDSQNFSYAVNFEENRDNDFIPRQWANRRVGYLLNQIRLYGENQEVKDEIVELAMRYGIITPYTSMLVVEDESPIMPMDDFVLRDSVVNMPGAEGGGFGGDLSARMSPPEAARVASEELGEMESGAIMEKDEGLEGAVEYAGDKTFYMNNDGFWVDSVYDPDTYDSSDEFVVVYLSDEYFDLLTEKPEIADYLTVGDSIVLVYEGAVYRIKPE